MNIRQPVITAMLAIFLLACTKQSTNPGHVSVAQWSLAGTALADSAELCMAPQPDGSWGITWPLRQGTLRFRADKAPVYYGDNGKGLLETPGTAINIDSTANYIIMVNPSPGGYGFTVRRLRFP